MTSSQTEIETYENPNQIPLQNGVTANPKNLNYSKEKSSINYSVSKEIKQVVYAPGTIKRLTIAVAINKILTESEKEEIKNLVLSASGGNYERGDVITVSGLQFEGLVAEAERMSSIQSKYQKEELVNTVIDSIMPMILVFILGLFALLTLKNTLGLFSKFKLPKTVEQDSIIQTKLAEAENLITAVDKEAAILKRPKTSKETSINELNDIIMQSPEEAAKVITSYLKE
jgi:flagellar M-ring protein FliF